MLTVLLAGLVTEHNQVHANLVFLGDHKQLGPILESEYASGLGLGVSLMERIMTLPKYTANPEFDPKYVTQLLDNYRSHAAILQFPNVQFYEGKLRARADPEIVDSACQWRMLPKKNFPIILHSVLANCNQEKAGFSFYNMTEVKEVKAYVNQLLINGINGKQILPDDIGIVSPYKAQRSKLKDAFKNFPGIEIGTAEYYQGREKMIIIITTVRSGKSIGFLKDEKRLNVALTRAMCLMILVCNPVTLQKDEMWRSFIEYCDRNNAIVGHIFDVKATAGGLCAPEEYVDSFDNFAEN